VQVLLVIASILLAGLTLVHAQQRQPLMLSHLTWFDRSGKNLGTVGPLGDHGNIELSPDGSQVASAVSDRTIGTRDIWIYRVAGSSATRLTSSPSDENWMVWSGDGRRAIVNAFSRDSLALFDTPIVADGLRRPIGTDDEARWPVSLSPDGRFLLYVTSGARTSNDIWVLPMTGGQPAYPFRRSAASENWAAFSPDGRFVAFSSTESGAPEIFVTPFPGPGPSWRVSPDIGTQTRWRQANEIVYIDDQRRLTAVSLRISDSAVTATRATPLFEISYPYGAYHAFDVSRDGQRILVNTTVVSGREPASIARSCDVNAGSCGPGLRTSFQSGM
jgi:eukaryotic-like serine/threonine-protein kinase